jgi:MoxR-like ATPase
MKNVPIQRTKAEDLVPSVHNDYMDTGILALLDQLAWKRPIILKGPKGSGKTLAAEQWAALQGIPMVRQDCSEDTSFRDLIGAFGIQGDEVYYGLGSLTSAIDIANEHGGCLYVAEELNALPPKAQKIMNAACDYRQAVEVANIGRVFKLKPGHKIWIIGTMNPNYGGTYNLNEDLRSRFGFVHVGYMAANKEKDLLLGTFTNPPAAAEKRIVDSIHQLALESRTGKLGDYALSTRDLVHFITDFEVLGQNKALKMLEGKYEGDDVKQFQARVSSLFTAVNLTNVRLIDHD